MKFSKSELEIINQYAAPTKAETLAGMKENVPEIKDLGVSLKMGRYAFSAICRPRIFLMLKDIKTVTNPFLH